VGKGRGLAAAVLAGCVTWGAVAAAPPVTTGEAGQMPPDDWQVVVIPMGKAKSCGVRRRGTDVALMIVADRKNPDVILIVVRPDWNLKFGLVHAALSIDGGPQESVDFVPLMNMAFFTIKDSAILVRLSEAKTVHWHFPWGDFSSDVTGFGKAVEMARDCRTTPRQDPPAGNAAQSPPGN
jgi:hypothetical protein